MMLNSHIMMRNPFVVLTLASSKITSNKYSFPNCFLLLPTPPPPPFSPGISGERLLFLSFCT